MNRQRALSRNKSPTASDDSLLIPSSRLMELQVSSLLRIYCAKNCHILKHTQKHIIPSSLTSHPLTISYRNDNFVCIDTLLNLLSFCNYSVLQFNITSKIRLILPNHFQVYYYKQNKINGQNIQQKLNIA